MQIYKKYAKKKYQEIRKGTKVFHKRVGIAAVCSNRSLALSSIPTASTQKHLSHFQLNMEESKQCQDFYRYVEMPVFIELLLTLLKELAALRALSMSFLVLSFFSPSDLNASADNTS